MTEKSNPPLVHRSRRTKAMLSRTLLANSSWYRCLCTKATLRRSIPICASYSHRRDMHEETKIKIPDFSQEFKGMDPSFPCLTEQAPRWGHIYRCGNNNFILEMSRNSIIKDFFSFHRQWFFFRTNSKEISLQISLVMMRMHIRAIIFILHTLFGYQSRSVQ